MKGSEGKEIRKIQKSWTIDPIKSFMDGEKGEQEQALITAGRNPIPVHDAIFWRAGKRAFDTINLSYGGNIATQEIREFFNHGPTDLIELWNSYETVFEPLIHEGALQIIPFGSDEPIQEFTALNSNSDEFVEHYIVEPYIRAVDDIFEASNLLNDTEKWPYDRELIAAFFTLSNVDLTASSIMFDRAQENTYGLVTYWFTKIDDYKQKKRAIKAQQEFAKRKKSQLMNERKHAKGNEAKQMVEEDWRRRKSEFASAAKAGLYYAEWLAERGYQYEPVTPTKWIREYAKANGIKLR